MSTATRTLLSQFDALQAQEKQEFFRELIQRLPQWDSGELSDDVAALAGDEMAMMLGEEERGSETR